MLCSRTIFPCEYPCANRISCNDCFVNGGSTNPLSGVARAITYKELLEPEMNLYKASKVAVWENFGSRLFNLRTECAVTQKMVGDAIGVTASYIGLLERGVRNPNFAVVVSLSKYFGVSIQTFLGES